MPTNPLWIEHTEKAAWDTVRALREQVELERARSERLTSLEPALPRIAELLDQAREELGLGARPPAALVEQILERLRQAVEERDELRRQLAKRRSAPKPAPPPEPSAPVAAVASQPSQPSAPRTKVPAALRWFVRRLERRQRELDADLAPSRGRLAEVATRVEEQLRGLVPLPYAPSALLERALDLGLAALDLARAAHRAEREG